MHKLLMGTLAALFLILLTSCVTVQVVKPGRTLTSDNGYIAIMFTNKIEPIAFGSKNVYVVLRQVDSGRKFYLPFTLGGELRLIAVKPGTYRIEDFVYMAGIDSVEGKDMQQKIPGVLYQAPKYKGTVLLSANYDESYRKDFVINAGEIGYIGGYSWESKFTFNEAAVVITRSFESDGSVFYAVRRDHPDMPASMTFKSIAE